jgi:2-methylcitrate dehydratase PrpD
VEAAKLAAAGFVSRPDGLECDQGLGWTHHGEGNESAFDGLGETYVFETVQHKLHACCHGTHAALEALIEARDTHQVQPESIEKIEIYVNTAWLKVCDIPQPSTGLEIKFSYRMTSAMVLHNYDTAAISTFDDALCEAPELVELRDKVIAVADEEMNETQATVTITLTTGEAVTVSHDLADPISYETLAQKVKAKADTLLGQALAQQCWAVIDEDGADLALLDPIM